MNKPSQQFVPDQSGSAMIETLAISGVLVTFMIGIPMIGTLIDLKQNTIQASRYAAWEKTVQKNSINVEDQIDARFFMDASSPIRTIEPGENQLGTNLLWGHKRTTAAPASANGSAPGTNGGGADTGNSRELLPLHERARVTAKVGEMRTGITEVNAGLMFDKVGKIAALAGSVGGGSGWKEITPGNGRDRGVFVNGLLRSEIEVEVEGNELLNMQSDTCTQGGAGCVKESTTILVDGWSAANPAEERARVRGFVPTSRLEEVGALISKVKVLPMLKDLGNLERAFGCVKLGVKPAQEVTGTPTATPAEGDDC